MDFSGLIQSRLGQHDLEKIPEDLFWHQEHLFQFLIDEELVIETELLQWVSEISGFEYADSVGEFSPMDGLAGKVDLDFARRHGFALGKMKEAPVLLTAKPFSVHGQKLAGLHFEDHFSIVLSTENQIRSALDEAFRQRGELRTDELDLDDLSDELQESDNLMNVRDKSPLVRLFYESLTHAIDNSASDIHYQPIEDGLVIRERIDGVLQDVRLVPRSQQDALLSLVKVMGGMDIAERRKTQDGRSTRMYSDRKIDIRISVVPTAYGERAVLRLLEKSAKLLDVVGLGLAGENREKMKMILKNFTNGIVLVTGPTGSGKSTTLCAVLSSLDSKESNIMTIEDPIEYELKGISQLEVQEKKNVTFATGLRALVRQDPDIMMVGEIRDEETAGMAVQAALTGHLVFSTMHTNDAPGSIARMQELGVEPFLIASSVVAVMAQRLVRRVCVHCREAYTPTEQEIHSIGLEGKDVTGPFYRGKGCPECMGRGYRGRTAIYEILIINDLIREQIVDKVSSSVIKRDALLRKEMRTLRMDGAQKVMDGLTTLEEVLRMTQMDVY